MTKGSKLRGIGVEHRPMYLFAERQDDSCSESPHVSFEPAICFLRKLWLSMASLLGDKAEAVAESPLYYSDGAQKMYDSYRTEAEGLVREAPGFAQPTVSKHFFTAGSATVMNHLYIQVLKAMQLSTTGPPACLLPNWRVMGPEVTVAATSFLWLQVYSLHVIRNEMALSPAARADPIVEVETMHRDVGSESALK